MEDIIDEIDYREKFTDREIFTKIWTRPRAILKFINEFKYDKFSYPLLAVIGMTNAFDYAVERGLRHQLGLLSILSTCIILGGLLGWISYYIFAALICWTGKAFDGVSDTRSIFRMLIYASIPAVLVLILYIIQIFCWGLDVFKVNHDYTVGIIPQDIMYWLIIIIELLLSLFTLVFTVVGISEVQKFGIGKAILNLLLPLVFLMIPVLLIYVLSM